jgi:mannose/fructose-specific phosphotransferase system component IIA
METGILIATHGRVGQAMLEACEGMLGAQERCAALSLEPGMGLQDFAALLRSRRDAMHPCLVLVDMLGGTPWNAALVEGLPPDGEVLAGLSLPLLLEALASRSLPPRELAASLLSKAQGVAVSASRLLEGRPR